MCCYRADLVRSLAAGYHYFWLLKIFWLIKWCILQCAAHHWDRHFSVWNLRYETICMSKSGLINNYGKLWHLKFILHIWNVFINPLWKSWPNYWFFILLNNYWRGAFPRFHPSILGAVCWNKWDPCEGRKQQASVFLKIRENQVIVFT